MSTANDLAHANFMALAADAPDALLGIRLMLNSPRTLAARRPETTDEQARATFLAAANDAPGAVIGSVGCCCPVDRERQLYDFQHDCGKHGTYRDLFVYHEAVMAKRQAGRLIRPRGLGRA